MSRTLYFRVLISLEGLPIHAWSLATASAILSPSCWIESFDELSSSRQDLSSFHLVAWSLNPSAIPKEKMVVIVEPDLLPDGSVLDHGVQVFQKQSDSRELQEALAYEVIIHIHSIDDFSFAAIKDKRFAPSSDDSGFGGLPEDEFDDRSPRRHFFQIQAGKVDGSSLAGGRDDATGGLVGSGWGSVRSWKLPHMSEVGPTTLELGSSARVLRWGAVRQGSLAEASVTAGWPVTYEAMQPRSSTTEEKKGV